MHTGRKSGKTGQFPDRPIVSGSFVFRPIHNAAEKLAKIKFVPDQKSAENRLKQPIRAVQNSSEWYLFVSCLFADGIKF